MYSVVDIESKANKVLLSYFESKGKTIEAPIDPIDILEYKGYSVDYVNGKYDNNTYGTLKIKDKVVEVNADISYNEGMENFTIAHEIGHIELHATNLKNSDSPECDLTALNNDSQIEKEADIFAACILMPEDLVKEAFYQIRKSPLFLKDGFLLRLIGKKIKQSALLILLLWLSLEASLMYLSMQ